MRHRDVQTGTSFRGRSVCHFYIGFNVVVAHTTFIAQYVRGQTLRSTALRQEKWCYVATEDECHERGL